MYKNRIFLCKRKKESNNFDASTLLFGWTITRGAINDLWRSEERY